MENKKEELFEVQATVKVADVKTEDNKSVTYKEETHE